MAVIETLVLYTTLGIAVATALAVSGDSRSLSKAILHTALWPFFAAALFDSVDADAPRGGAPGEGRPPTPRSRHPRIRRAERRLLAALSRLDGLAEDVLGPEVERIRNLARSLDSMQAELDEMDELLASDAFDECAARSALEEARAEGASEARLQSLRSRLEHLRRLQTMRAKLRSDLRTALGKVDEITTQISLLRFADHPEREVSDLIEDIAATVDGVSEGMLDSSPA